MINAFLKAIFLGSVFSFTCTLHAQQCDGNLGENIFTDGDFGTGLATILVPDPGIAPGFIYQTNPPPNDGEYTITNNMGAWNSVWGSWLAITDNSPDPEGYMMVVNASFEPGLFYEQEVTGLCGNQEYEFSADIFNLIESGTNLIKPNVSFLLDGIEVYTTGTIPESEQWETHSFSFETVPGQSSVTLSLRNNAPGGIGNDLAIDNISFRPCGPKALILPYEIENICEDGEPIDLEATIDGEQFDTPFIQWQQSLDEGNTWQDIPGANDLVIQHDNLNAGFYYYRYILANGISNFQSPFCQIISNIKIVQVVPKFFSIQDSICIGLDYEVGTSVYSSTGSYTDSLISSIGCDSIVLLDLTVLPDPGIMIESDITDPSCSYSIDGTFLLVDIQNGQTPYSYAFNGTNYSLDQTIENLAAGVYDVQITDKYGCQLNTQIELESPIEFIVNIGENQEIDLGQIIQITPNHNFPIQDFTWVSNESIQCPTCWELDWIPVNDAFLILNAISEKGCVASNSIQVRVLKTRDLYIPNIFSPNRDGQNDYFAIFSNSAGIKEIQRLSVYDRWGNKVFSRSGFLPNNPELGWDGKYRGRSVNPGVFSYSLEVLYIDGFLEKRTGSITLLR